MQATLSPSPVLPPAGWMPDRAPHLPSALGVLGLHVAAGLLLWQGAPLLREPVRPPVQVSLLQADRPAAPPPAPAAAATPLPQPPLSWVPVPIPDIPVAQRELAPNAPPLAAPAAPATALALASGAALAPPSAAATSAPAAPKAVPSASLRWRVEPAVELPRLSRRAGEQGRVLLRVIFDASGAPREAQVHKSSGFPRLDAQALEAIRVARITPFLEDGRPIEVVATAVLDYELE